MHRERAVLIHFSTELIEDGVIALHVSVRAVHGDGPEGVVLRHFVGRGVVPPSRQPAVVVDLNSVLVRKQAPSPGAGEVPELLVRFPTGGHETVRVLFVLVELSFVGGGQLF